MRATRLCSYVPPGAMSRLLQNSRNEADSIAKRGVVKGAPKGSLLVDPVSQQKIVHGAHRKLAESPTQWGDGRGLKISFDASLISRDEDQIVKRVASRLLITQNRSSDTHVKSPQ